MDTVPKIVPLPAHVGHGLTSSVPLDKTTMEGYRYEPKGRFHNYFATTQNWAWPSKYVFA